ncbi:hypothetical protein L7F22_017159 [Adiantum nelumboides]|nr:hypothetical protein [Adiantum nelumboides]
MKRIPQAQQEGIKGSPSIKESPKGRQENVKGSHIVKKRPRGRQEIIEESPSEKLLDYVLEDGGDMEVYSNALEIFNPKFSLSSIMFKLKDLLVDEMVEFDNAIDGQCFQIGDESYYHLTDFTKLSIEKATVTKRFGRFSKKSSFCAPISIACPVHKKPCNLVFKDVAFIFYLFLKCDGLDKVQESDISTGKEDADTNVNAITLLQLEKGEILEEEEIDVMAEEKESANFDVAEFKAATIIDEPTGVAEVFEASLIVPTLPFFYINGKDYIPLFYFQCLLNIREDYCIAGDGATQVGDGVT